jgi:dTDP-4-dehydrorhamnose 3,5-epimerase
MLKQIDQIDGIQVFVAKSFIDPRGVLLQSYVRSDLERIGIPGDFRQAIQSISRRSVVRGLHFQWDPPQGKLIRCVQGGIFDVLVDIRHGSCTRGDHLTIELTGENNRVLWIPPGFAHGFMALADDTIVLYECTAEWNPACEGGILWNDPALRIDWPPMSAVVSEKDSRSPTLSEWMADPRSRAFRIISSDPKGGAC